MSAARINARSQRREELPDSLRLYGLEGITETQDEAISQHSLTLARHDERLNAHDISLATLTEQTKTLVTVTTTLAGSVNKLLFAVVGSSIGVATTVVIANAIT